MSFVSLLRTSRPRFWIYLLGPALIGMAAAMTHGGQWTGLAIIALFVFTFPANLFLYGVNDIFDQETDRLNPKKQGYEQLLDPRDVRKLFFVILLSLIPFAVIMFFLPWAAVLSFSLFIFLGAFYSAPPIRAKARPFLDAFFNSLYLMPALVTWYAFDGGEVNWLLIMAGIAWCMAMHAYSAVPDIAADRASGIRTIATTLEKKGTLWLCMALYLVAAGTAYLNVGALGGILGFVYLALMGVSLATKTSADLFRVYRVFPWVNTAMGMLLFWWILFARFA